MSDKPLPDWFTKRYWNDASEAIESLLLAHGNNAAAAYEALQNLALGENHDFMSANGSKWAMMGLACFLADDANQEIIRQFKGYNHRECLAQAIWYLNQIKLANARDSVHYWPGRPPSPDGYIPLMVDIYRRPEFWNPDDPESRRRALAVADRLEAEYRANGY